MVRKKTAWIVGISAVVISCSALQVYNEMSLKARTIPTVADVKNGAAPPVTAEEAYGEFDTKGGAHCVSLYNSNGRGVAVSCYPKTGGLRNE